MGDGKALAHSYRTLQHWNLWLTQHFLGNNLLKLEEQLLSRLLINHFGKHVLLLGVPSQYPLLQTVPIPCHSILTPLMNKSFKNEASIIDGDFRELPFLSGSVDLVMLPHTLEFVDNPRQLLAEACRIIKPEGLIVICGFKPLGSWGIKKMLVQHKKEPWSGNFIHIRQIKKWLQLADFSLEKQISTLFRPPISKPLIYNKLNILENIGIKWFPLFGGGYILLARAKVIPLTPIRLKWKQQLSGIGISNSISGYMA